MKNMMKNEKGITLIALIITIIVLLILAGVSIAMLTGENGILNRAQETEYENAQGTFREAIALVSSELVMAAYTDANTELDISAATITAALNSSNYMSGYTFASTGDVITATGTVNMTGTLTITDGVYKGVAIEKAN